MNLEELYKDTILYHGRNTENKREVQNRIKLEFKHIDDWQFAIELFHL